MAVPARRNPGAHHRAIQQMVDALQAEVAATRTRREKDWKAIGIGTRVAAGRQSTLYAFQGVGRLSLKSGHLVQLKAGGCTVTARVVDLSGSVLTLDCPRDVGPKMGPARVYRDPSWLLVAQQAALRSLSTAPRRAALLLEPWLARTGIAAPTSKVRRASRGLNAEQAAAVRMAVASELHYLWGPPGTGKTTTLAAVAEALHRRGESVLLVAPTNEAVDHLLLAVAQRLRNDPVLTNRRVLRLGDIESAELRRRYGPYVDLERIVRNRSGAASTARRTRAMKQVLARLASEDLTDAAETELRRRLQKDLRRLQRGQSGRQVRRDLLRRQHLERARIVATTLHKAYLPGQLDRSFDSVVIDEASAASVPLVFLATALRARKRVIVGGDFRQLPPIVRARSPSARKWLGRNAFEVGRLAEAVEKGKTPRMLSVLRRQYRMHPTICRLVSSYAYGGRLRTARSRALQPWNSSVLVGNDPLMLIDTSPFYTVLVSGQSRANPAHGLVIRVLLRELLGGGGGRGSRPTVAVVSPYKKQLQAHRKRFGQSYSAAFLTVHAAQGKEFDVVIFDLPSASGVQPSPFARARSLADAGARLNNVAASRAREQLLVVADCAYYRDHGLSKASVGRFLGLVEDTGRRVSCHRVVRSLPTAS